MMAVLGERKAALRRPTNLWLPRMNEVSLGELWVATSLTTDLARVSRTRVRKS